MISLERYSNQLILRNDHWNSLNSSNVSYPDQGNADSFESEENSFWFEHRNDIIAKSIRNFSPNQKIIFDVGGGNGFVSRRLLKEGFNPVVVEPGISGVRNSINRGIETVIHGSFQDAEFENNIIPSVGLFDVLEHIDDDISFLKDIFRSVEYGGFIYLTVPAYNFLWSYEDVYGGHFRRYTMSGLKKVLNSAGFKFAFGSYFFSILPVPIFFKRTLPSLFGARKEYSREKTLSEHKKSSVSISLLNLLSFETKRISKLKTIPVGGSIIVVGLKPVN